MVTRKLETLNLGSNDLNDETIFAIKEALMHNRSLRRLGLQATKLSDEGALFCKIADRNFVPKILFTGCIALAEYLADHPRFLRLDVRFNNIRGGGWLALSHAVKMSPAIIRVDMNYSFKDVKHFETIRECQKTIQTVCLDNIEKFERGLTLPDLEEETEPEEEGPVESQPEALIDEEYSPGKSTITAFRMLASSGWKIDVN